MSNINILPFVIDAASSTTTDNIKLLNRSLYIGATAAKQVRIGGEFLTIVNGSFKKKVATAAVNGVDTLTFSGTANSVEYTFTITQYNRLLKTYYVKTIDFYSPATGTLTTTDIATIAKRLIQADPQLHVTVSQSTNVLTLTTTTGYELITYSTATTNVAKAQTTQGVLSYGLTPYYALNQYSLVSGTDFTGSTAGYTTYQFDYLQPFAPDLTTYTAAVQTCFIAINTDSANAAALITAADAIFAQAAFNANTVKIA